LLDFYRTSVSADLLPALDVATLRFPAAPGPGGHLGGLGIGVILFAIWGLNRALLNPFLRPGARLVDQIADYRRRERGPRVVALGGGHGLAALLRGLKNHTYNLTAVVTVADDGGSSGALRQSLGILPPGDIRNCLAALSNDEALLTQLFQYRFSDDSGLGGHSFATSSSPRWPRLPAALRKRWPIGAGLVRPRARAAGHPARCASGGRRADPACGQPRTRAGREQHPRDAGAGAARLHGTEQPVGLSARIQAILAADMIVIGPGSLYTKPAAQPAGARPAGGHPLQ